MIAIITNVNIFEISDLYLYSYN